MPVIFAFYFFRTSLLLRHLSLVHGHVSFFIFSLFTLPLNLLWLGQFIAFLRQHFYTLSSNIPPFSPAVRLRDFNSTYFVKFEIAWIRTHSYRSLRCSVSAFIDFRQVDSHWSWRYLVNIWLSVRQCEFRLTPGWALVYFLENQASFSWDTVKFVSYSSTLLDGSLEFIGCVQKKLYPRVKYFSPLKKYSSQSFNTSGNMGLSCWVFENSWWFCSWASTGYESYH